jgi:predicted ATP-dependent endonuclease of OLD family
MARQATEKSFRPTVLLACVEISHYRRLEKARIFIDPEMTILVGANNSGKTSILLAIRQFLADGPSFGAFDLSVDKWCKLRKLGEAWEALDQDPSLDDTSALEWEQHLHDLLSCMPAVDLWFDVQIGAFHVVAPLIPSLQWSGGHVGVRLRLEPVSNVKELQELAWRFCEARRPVRDQSPSARAWPIDLLDFWLRRPKDLGGVYAYKLDPVKGPLATGPRDAPQDLPDTAVALDRSILSPLIRVDFIAAQRGLGSEEASGRPGTDSHRVGLFSNQLLRFARQHFNQEGPGPSNHPELLEAVAKAQTDLDKQIRTALESSIQDVKELGYPGLHDPQELHFRTRIHTAELLDHSTAVQYRLDGQQRDTFLPEHAIGLGYQNLQSLSYQLVSFRVGRFNPTKGAPAAVHLVLLEEPEAHLHVQVQRIFPKRAIELIKSKDEGHFHLASQLILSTHASHLAHSESFTRLRYVRRLPPRTPDGMPSTEVVNLADVFGDDQETRTFAERYFQVQHTDLLFADAAIFVEGTAERMIVPYFIERDFEGLRTRYLSFLDVGGSHAHRLKPLVERLGLPTLVITDIDPIMAVEGPTGKVTWKAVAIENPTRLASGNATLRKWHPVLEELTDFENVPSEGRIWSSGEGSRVRFAWQDPISPCGPWPSSFEDSFILTNLEWFRSRTNEKGALGRAVRTVMEHADPHSLNGALHEMLRDSFNKGDLAATIFERLCAGEDLKCPDYISTALTWLQQELDPSPVEVER